ncbi:hypothetical protein PV04_07126 [Phialophora macrospora]|uniref:Uncharacterized protein n=1 Tax=Phialophora macrospora TaxID=1851006 RepID=A0A0D2E0M6_9EURO|nr:hypothetical protein PV04_07126 [Phialophora macrospora]
MNEGDLVVRAELAHLSLADLLFSALPFLPTAARRESVIGAPGPLKTLGGSLSRLDLSLSARKKVKSKNWRVPSRKLCGKLFPPSPRMRVADQESQVSASIDEDSQLRQVMFGDPLVHAMGLCGED